MPADPADRLPPGHALSRRRFLTLSAFAAALPFGVPLGAPSGTALGPLRAYGVEDGGAAYRAAFGELLAEDGQVRLDPSPGREYLYRPGQLLAAEADAEAVVARLHSAGYTADPGEPFAGVARLLLDQEAPVPELVDWLRDPAQWPDQPVPAVQPHHVLTGCGNIMGNPDAPPLVAGPLPPPDPGRTDLGAGVAVGICDTGIWAEAAGAHPEWLGGSYDPDPDDEDPVYRYGDVLALQGGHGTFVAGVARQAAPGVWLDPEPALACSGIGDEALLVSALGALAPEVALVNLSLGCFTHDDQPPLPVVNALQNLPSAVAVAAAGNAGTSRPMWPAALPGVVGVAAVRQDADGEPVGDPASNHGDWVDACAGGARHSTYVSGRLVLPGLPPQQFEGHATWTGTSFATAHVTGALAATMTRQHMSAADARAALRAEPRWHPDYGVLVT